MPRSRRRLRSRSSRSWSQAVDALGGDRDPGVLGGLGRRSVTCATWSGADAAAACSRSTFGSTSPAKVRAPAARLVRWRRIQLGELAVEIQGGHRLLTFQVEALGPHGADAEGDRIGAFAQSLFAAVDGRPVAAGAARKRRATAAAGRKPAGAIVARQVERKSVAQRRGAEGIHTLIAAVIFDLDGVLVDSEIWWDEVRRLRRGTWTALDARGSGGGHGRQLADVGPDHARASGPRPDGGGDRAGRSSMAWSIATDAEGAPLIAGAVEAVRRIAARLAGRARLVGPPRGDRRGARDDRAGRHLRGRRVVRRGRPRQARAGRLSRGRRRLGVDPRDCLVVEDSLNGVLAAQGGRDDRGPRSRTSASRRRRAAGRPPTTSWRAWPTSIPTRSRRRADRGADARPAPARPAGTGDHPIRRTIRYWLSRLVVGGPDPGLPSASGSRAATGCRRAPAIYCFNHLSWTDPFVLMAVLPFRPRLWFFGPKEEDMAVGGRNRVMRWTGTAIPYKPGKNDLLEATRRVGGRHRDRRRRRHRRRGPDPRPRIGAPAAQRGRRLLRAAVRRAARAGRDQRHELAAVRRAGHGQGGGAASPVDGRARPAKRWPR